MHIQRVCQNEVLRHIQPSLSDFYHVGTMVCSVYYITLFLLPRKNDRKKTGKNATKNKMCSLWPLANTAYL